MKVFYDTEFIEDGNTIDLISIGVVAEDGRELYLINNECDWERANDWVKEHVISKLTPRPENFVSREEIKARLLRFLGYHTQREWYEEQHGRPLALDFFEAHGIDPSQLAPPREKLELWGYYSAYDHVVLCQLFGPMIDLPKGMPMYTRDIKQWCVALGDPKLPEQGKGEHNALADARWNRQAWEFLRDFQAGPPRSSPSPEEADERPRHVIFKYSLSHGPGQVLELPQGATPVHVDVQGDTLQLWVRQPQCPEGGTTPRTFRVVATGQPFPATAHHIGTCQQGPYVWHVVELTDVTVVYEDGVMTDWYRS
ncbi:3'-5' exoribonuclease [Deinococcus carri]|uniref:3'-5' exoribonuclease n=1 Tax=Deinococcus carri TaxID=1211323 RepID=A0ABP9W8G0_9DEIO